MIRLILALVLSAGSVASAQGLGEGETDLQRRFAIGVDTPPAVYPGTVDAPPVPHFRQRLPGGRSGSGSHTERGAPLIYGDLVMLGSATSNALHAISRRDGSVIQSYPASGPVQSAPVRIGDRIIFSDTGGATWCYALNGERVWMHEGNAPILATPTLTDDVVYIANVDDLVVALERDTGELRWRYERPPSLSRTSSLALFASPAPAVSGEFLYAGFSDGVLVALNASSGDPVWETPVGEGEYPDLVAGLVAYSGDVYTSGYFAPFAAVEATNETVRWRVEAGSAATPLLDVTRAEPVFYHPGSDGHLRAVIARTGEVLWDWDSGRSGALTEIVPTEAGLLFGVADGGVYLVNPDDGSELWHRRGTFRLNGVSAAPAVEGRQIVFVTNAGYVYSMLTPVPTETVSRRPWDSVFE